MSRTANHVGAYVNLAEVHVALDNLQKAEELMARQGR